MTGIKPQKHQVHPDKYTILAPIPPFVDQILNCCPVRRDEFPALVDRASKYTNDPRLIEMVRKAGDASAKVPYLLDYGETPESILATLRALAQPHIERIKTLPEPLQATINSLLSINIVPHGCESYGIWALLEIDRIQKEMTDNLHELMANRRLAKTFHADNQAALIELDREWPTVRQKNIPWPVSHALPEKAKMQFHPIFFTDHLVGIREICVIVDAPEARELRHATPPILQNPLPEQLMPPPTGSTDWLIRMVGKIGRHFTRALLETIVNRLEDQRRHPQHSAAYFDQIDAEVQEAVRWYIDNKP